MWKPTEKHPEYADHCKRICARYDVKYEDFDVVRIAIEENLVYDAIEGSVPVAESLPEVRRFIFEPLPQHWGLPPLVVVFQIEPEAEPESDPPADREFTLRSYLSREWLARAARVRQPD